MLVSSNTINSNIWKNNHERFWVSCFYKQKICRIISQQKKDCLVSETIHAKTITDEEIMRIHQLEQDAWAHWIEEYLSCVVCQKIEWKSERYWTLPNAIQKRTVWTIEKILWEPIMLCKCCGWNMKAIYGQDYLWEIVDRYKSTESYIWVLRDNSGIIQWFIDWYISDFSIIYDREFQQYYWWSISEEKLKEYIEDSIGQKLPSRILFWSCIAINQRYGSLKNIYKLLKIFFDLLECDENLFCISEARLGTNISKIYKKMWAQAIGIWSIIDDSQILWKSQWLRHDIFTQQDIVKAYRSWLTMSPNDFWRFCFREE